MEIIFIHYDLGVWLILRCDLYSDQTNIEHAALYTVDTIWKAQKYPN